MKTYDDLTDQEIFDCICGPGITVDLVKSIINESNSLINKNYINTELFSAVFIKHLEKVMPSNLKSNGDWACGYITADNLNELMNPGIVYED
jgi:hypothetical protein